MAANGAAGRLGFRRITWVRVVLDERGASAEAHGVGHRLPRSVPVTLATASALAAGGVPLLLLRRRAADAPAGAR